MSAIGALNVGTVFQVAGAVMLAAVTLTMIRDIKRR